MGSEQGDETLSDHSRCPQNTDPTLTSLSFLHAGLPGNRTLSDVQRKERVMSKKNIRGCGKDLSESVFLVRTP
jgi:hypothetical protein